MIINNSKGKDYYTQRNNEIKPGSACNVTAMINALACAGYKVDGSPWHKQPEDDLLCFIMCDEICASHWRRLDPNGAYPPNEWHNVLCVGANRWLRARGVIANDFEAVSFSERVPVDFLRSAIQNGGCGVCTGKFAAGNNKIIGHVFAVVGFETDANNAIKNFIIDDPWGDYRDEYKSQNGNDIFMPYADFIQLARNQMSLNKICHIVKANFGAIKNGFTKKTEKEVEKDE